MYVVAGVTGKVGSATASSLLDAGRDVRVLVRRQADAEPWRARGAEVSVVSLEERGPLSEALQGCAGFFALLPFDLTVDDFEGLADHLVTSIAGAVADAGVPHVVMLSSGGADLAEETGPIASLHRLERALGETGTTLTALRSGHFQEKFHDVIDIVRESAVYPVFASSADVPLPVTATADLGVIAAEALQSPPATSETVDVLGPVYTEREIAARLGEALGSDLHVETIPEVAWAAALTEAGFRQPIAESLAEMYRADEHGLLAPRGDRLIRTQTPIEATIAKTFAASAVGDAE